jgi:hypothetical protein
MQTAAAEESATDVVKTAGMICELALGYQVKSPIRRQWQCVLEQEEPADPEEACEGRCEGICGVVGKVIRVNPEDPNKVDEGAVAVVVASGRKGC